VARRRRMKPRLEKRETLSPLPSFCAEIERHYVKDLENVKDIVLGLQFSKVVERAERVVKVEGGYLALDTDESLKAGISAQDTECLQRIVELAIN